MKALFIRFSTLTYGVTLLTGVCLLVTIATQIPQFTFDGTVSSDRNQFPQEDERRGAGTRWTLPLLPRA
ncbi:MAG: hypothetical protein AAF215_29675 [Cyanobacteria bacterium P01_A01_bin.123]